MPIKRVVLLTVPGLRARDLAAMPALRELVRDGDQLPLIPNCPAVTWPVQANMLTGVRADLHGVVANGFYWRDRREVEMWTAWNEKITAPQIWDQLHQQDPGITSAVWFPMLSKGCGADVICMPAPVHNPDGSESLWCYTKPVELYGALRDQLGHFPLQHFWGPLANIKSTAWIVESAVVAAGRFQPRFSYLYLPHLDYAAQKFGPDSPQAVSAVSELDAVIQRLGTGLQAAFAGDDVCWLVAGEYAISPVTHVTFPNRMLRSAGLLRVRDEPDGEQLDLEHSPAWALVDHQIAHVFVQGRDSQVIDKTRELFSKQEGIAEVLVGEERARYGLNHERSGELVLISSPHSWQAYYWWLDDSRAPAFARTVDIHRKPGYDPVELCFDFATKSIPLDASLIRGSHGAPVTRPEQETVFLSSQPVGLTERRLRDTDVCGIVRRQFQES